MIVKRVPLQSNSCIVCGLKTTFGCSNCKQVYYCSAEHQRQHWATHQGVCGGITKQQEIPLQEESKPQAARKMTDTVATPAQKTDKKAVVEKQSDARDRLTEDHERYRQIAIRLVSQKDYQDALNPIKKSIELATQLELSGNKNDFFEKIANMMLLARVYINLNDFDNARRILIQVLDGIKHFAQQVNQKQELLKIIQLLQVVAQQFYQTGDQRNCELAYVDYVMLVEKSHGEQSASTGNAYFLVGVFYLQHKHYTQALACFKRTLNIRMNINEQDEGVADCWYNIGVVYKQCGKKEQSIEFLEKSLKMRRQLIGDNSMPVASCLECLGKIYMNSNDYKTASQKFQECFNIRKQLINNPQHPEIERISKLIVQLYQKVSEGINAAQRNSRPQPLLMNIFDKLQNTILDNKILDVEPNDTSDPFITIEQSSQSEVIKKQARDRTKSLTGVQPLRQFNHIPNKKSETDDNRSLTLSAPLLESMSIDQLIQLKQLNAELAKTKVKSDINQLVLDSEFINSLSSMQLSLVKESNQQIFGKLQLERVQQEQYWSDQESDDQGIIQQQGDDKDGNMRVSQLLDQQRTLQFKGKKYFR